MNCYLCNGKANFEEEYIGRPFCDLLCQTGFHLIDGQFENKDLIFSFLLHVPPSELFRFYEVNKQFRDILTVNNTFKIKYVKLWRTSDEFYLRAFLQHREWLSFLVDYNGFFAGIVNVLFSLERAILANRVDIVSLLLKNIRYSDHILKYAIGSTVNYDILVKLFQYGNPDNQILVDAVIKRAEPRVISLILNTRAITNVDDAIRMAVSFNDVEIVELLDNFQNKKIKTR